MSDMTSMKADIYFSILLPYTRTEFEPLKKLAVSYRYDGDARRYRWMFHAKDYPSVLKIVGAHITPNRAQIDMLTKNPVYEEIELEKWKGKGKYEIKEYPKIYILYEYRKAEDGEIQKIRNDVTKEMVATIWSVIRTYPKDKWVKGRTIAERICSELNVTRFNRNSGTFDFAKFFGTRNAYFRYYYYPLRVLVYLGIVDYSKKGLVRRIKDTYEEQKKYIEYNTS